jgi:hypothetical protein
MRAHRDRDGVRRLHGLLATAARRHGPAPSYVASLDADRRAALAGRLEESLPQARSGTIALARTRLGHSRNAVVKAARPRGGAHDGGRMLVRRRPIPDRRGIATHHQLPLPPLPARQWRPLRHVGGVPGICVHAPLRDAVRVRIPPSDHETVLRAVRRASRLQERRRPGDDRHHRRAAWTTSTTSRPRITSGAIGWRLG